ncbi:hypothetical protein D9M68_518800 [compost metagenome]
MQHDDGAGRCRVQGGQHAVEVDAALGGVVVGVALDREAGVGEQRAVVFPARVADQHGGVGVELLEEVGADLQAAGAADGLDGGHAAGGDGLALGAEDQALDGVVVGHDAVDRQVAAGRWGLHHVLLGGLHALEQGQLAVVVVIHADAEIDLVGVGVGCKLLVEAEDRVARRHFDRGEHRHGKVLWDESFAGNRRRLYPFRLP